MRQMKFNKFDKADIKHGPSLMEGSSSMSNKHDLEMKDVSSSVVDTQGNDKSKQKTSVLKVKGHTRTQSVQVKPTGMR